MPRKLLSVLLSLANLICGSTLLQAGQGDHTNGSSDTPVSKRLLSNSLPLVPLKPAPKAEPEPREEARQTIATQKSSDPNSETVLRLEDLIAEALANNPEIEAAERMVDAKKAVAPQQRTLPDPVISGGWTGNIVPPFSVQTGDPSSARMLGFSQEIPFPGKLALRGRIADTEATEEQWNYERTKLAVISNLEQTYYDLFFIEKAIATVQKDKDLLEKLAKIAEARYAVGKGMQQDVIRAQVEISKLLERVTLLEQRKSVAQAMLRSLLYRPPDAPIGVPAEVTKTEMPYSLSELEAIAEAHSPDLKSQEREIDKGQLALNLAKKDYYPDFGVGFTYYNRPQLPEMYSLNFTAKVPIYFWKKQRYGVEEAASSLVSSRKRTEAVKANLFFKVKDQYLAMKASERLMELYSKAIVPQSTLALDSSLSGYQVGNIDFLSMLSNFLTVLDYELNYYDSLTNYQKAVARLEEVIGTGLPK
jgi:outer membrane protein, heavy metal efflux system